MFATDAAISFVTSFVIGAAILPVFIPALKRLKFGQNIREEGPKDHYKKSGTPTMGGLAILFTFLIGSVIFILNGRIGTDGIAVLLTTAAFGLLGFADDYIKIKKKRSLGLRAWQKLLGQVIISAVFIAHITTADYSCCTPFGLETTAVLVPFVHIAGGLDLGVLYAPFIMFIFLGGVNGVNLTDGLDGLNTGVTLIVALFLAAAGSFAGADAVLLAFPMAGALLAFLLYNCYPARVFMGDTGSFLLGGFVVSMAVIFRLSLFLPIVGFIYMAEALSVLIQVGYFKAANGKRFFKMAPIHHHYELKGMPEPKITACFCVITAVLCFIGVYAIRV